MFCKKVGFACAINKENIGILKEISLEDVKRYNVLAFLDRRGWKSSLRREQFMHDIKENVFSKAAKNALSLKVDGLAKFDVESINTNDIEFVWKTLDEIHYGGLIIEELMNGEWVRVARIGDTKTRKTQIKNVNSGFTHEFRAKVFYLDGSVALYSDYKYIKIFVQ